MVQQVEELGPELERGLPGDRVKQRAKHVKPVTISAVNATNARKIGAIRPRIGRFRQI